MSRKTVRVLSIIAMCLYGAALLITLLSLPLHRQFKMMVSASLPAVGYFVIPLPQLVSVLLSFGISLTLMILVLKLRTDRASKIAVLALAIAWGVRIVVNLLCSLLFTMSVVNMLGTAAMASLTFHSTALNYFVTPLESAGGILTLLAMGAFCSRAGQLNRDAMPAETAASGLTPETEYKQQGG